MYLRFVTFSILPNSTLTVSGHSVIPFKCHLNETYDKETRSIPHSLIAGPEITLTMAHFLMQLSATAHNECT